MRPSLMLLLVLVWAVSLCALPAAAKKGDYLSLLRQLRSPFERKLKGTRRGCSSYGHSCFGGYGKRGGGGGPALGEVAVVQGLPGRALPVQPPDPADDVILRQIPGSASARTPLWGRPLQPVLAARDRDHADADLVLSEQDQHQLMAAAEDLPGGPFDNTLTLASRWPMRRWLRAYRKPADRGGM